MIDYRLGDWRQALAGVERVDSVIMDPPYSERTHRGQRSGPESGESAIVYDGLSIAMISDATYWISDHVTGWAVIFCDHITHQGWSSALSSLDWYVFAPVPWVRFTGPRFAGDGPANGAEWICVARPLGKVRRSGSRPGWYDHAPVYASSGERVSGHIGQKPLSLMRQLVRDYSEPGDTIADLFAGVGTTLIAAQLEGRHAIGAELNPSTHAKGLRHIDRWTAQRELPCIG